MLVPIEQIPTIFRMLGVSCAGMFGPIAIAGVFQAMYQKPRPSAAQFAVIVLFLLLIGILPNIWVALFTRDVWNAKKKWRKNGLGRGTWLALLGISYGMGFAFFLLFYLTV